MNDRENRHFRFYHALEVRFSDTDLQGHVFFGNYLTFLDQGFLAYLRELGFGWDRLKKLGLEFYFVESACQYYGKSYVEDILHVHIQISKMGNSSLTVQGTVIRKESDEAVASGSLIAVMVDSRTSRPTRIPDEFRTAVELAQK
ncbi:MAG: acyl-CoA thioesterase [SAR324 cluster bacterium]|nr:acyl-CoA thioesterase [SAR324 cluster bacterium]